jgi:hypothetical protein
VVTSSQVDDGKLWIFFLVLKNFQMFDRKSIRGIQRRQNGYSDVFCGGKTLQNNISVLLKGNFMSQRTTLKNFQVEDSFESEARKNFDSYLVDPASSHMLVSKIKPCMSKYKQSIQ